MYKVLAGPDGRVMGMSLLGFPDVPEGCTVADMEGGMPESDGQLSDWVLADGVLGFDPLPPEPDAPGAEEPTNGEIMEAVMELAGIVAGMMEGE